MKICKFLKLSHLISYIIISKGCDHVKAYFVMPAPDMRKRTKERIFYPFLSKSLFNFAFNAVFNAPVMGIAAFFNHSHKVPVKVRLLSE